MNIADRKEIEKGLDDPEAMREASQRALRLSGRWRRYLFQKRSIL